MLKKNLMLAASGAAVLWLVGSRYTTPQNGIEFTKAALPAPAGIDIRASASPAHVVLPIAIEGLAERAEKTLPEGPQAVREVITDAVCAKRTTTFECNEGRLEGTIAKAGSVDLQVAADMIKLSFPVKYNLTITGMGWARQYSEQKAGEARVEVAFAIATRQGGGVEVVRAPSSTADDQTVKLLRANVKLTRAMDAHIKAFIKLAEDELKRTVAALPIQTALSSAWSVLAQPMELGRGSGMWLRGAPDAYTNGKLALANGKLQYQIPIASHLSIVEAEKVPASNTRRAAILSQDMSLAGPSRLRVAVPVDLEAIRQQVFAAFPRTEVFESRADRFSEVVRVQVNGTRVYPAVRQIGLELDVKVTTARGVTTGKFNLAGRPVLDQAAGMVTLADVSFPVVGGRDSGSQAPGVPRLGTEPFAGRLMSAAKLDISRALTDILPRATQLLDQQLGNNLRLVADFTKAEPVSFELTRDSAWLVVDLLGDLQIRYEGSQRVVAETASADAAPTSSTSVLPLPLAPMPVSTTALASVSGASIPTAAAAVMAAGAIATKAATTKLASRTKPEPKPTAQPVRTQASAPSKPIVKRPPPRTTNVASTFKPYNY